MLTLNCAKEFICSGHISVPPSAGKGWTSDVDEEREGGGGREGVVQCRRGFAVHLPNNKSAAVGSANDDEAGPVLIWMAMLSCHGGNAIYPHIYPTLSQDS